MHKVYINPPENKIPEYRDLQLVKNGINFLSIENPPRRENVRKLLISY